MTSRLAVLLLALALAAPGHAAGAKAPSPVAPSSANAPAPRAPAAAQNAAQGSGSAAPADDALLTAPGDPPAARLDAAKAALDKINAGLASETVTDADLVKLRGAVDPILAQVLGVAAEVAPKQAAIKARLDQLGPAPDPKANPEAAPEDPTVTQDRKDQQKLQATFDDLAKRANLLQVQAEQVAAQIGDRRRTLFANSVFQGGASILAPSLWLEVAREMPRDLAQGRQVFADFLKQLGEDYSAGEAALFLGLLAATLVAALAAGLVVRRVIPREKPLREANELRLSLAAVWSGLAVIAIPLAWLGAVILLFDWFEVSSAPLRLFGLSLVAAVVKLAVAGALITAILAPYRPLWRPIDLTDRVARRLAQLIVVLAALSAIGKVLEAGGEIAGASLQSTVAMRGLFALLIGLLLARGLYGLVGASGEAHESGRPASVVDEGPFWGPIRFLAWGATFAIVASALAGYIALSAFLVGQLAWISCVAGLLFLLLKLTDAATEQAFRPNSRISRNLTATLGVGRESLQQIGVLLSGVTTLALSALAIMLVLAPWGVQSHDMFGMAQSLFFGVKVGDVTISLSSMIFALVFFAVGYGLTRTIRGWLEMRYLPLTQLDQGLRDAISASVFYLGMTLSLGFAASYLGFSVEKLTIVLGALSVGIGLGLQGVVANFVSGMILMWERSIRVGDLVTVGDQQGIVRRINIRATEIETPDRATTIVPNGNMVSGVVKNFVRSDRVGRVQIPVQAVWEADPEQVRQILIDTAKSHEEVVGIPAPAALFTAFGEKTLAFDLVCFVEDVERAARVKSDLHFAIFRAFAEAGIKMVPPNSSMALDVSALEPLFRRLPPADEGQN